MTETYRSISKPGEGIYREKGSKFIGIALSLKSEAECMSRIEEFKKEHPKARHFCYAFSIGIDEEFQRANDDGEPRHSAGTPILNQIISSGLRNVGVVVIRYFGGTKLGVSGLISAYKQAANEALSHAEQKEFLITESIDLHFNYSQMGAFMRLKEQYQAELIHLETDSACKATLEMARAKIPFFLEEWKTIEKQLG